MRTLVVIPTYQEAENIADVLARVRAVVPSADVLVVDDNSPDGTADLAEVAGPRARRHLGAAPAGEGGPRPRLQGRVRAGPRRGLRGAGRDGRRPVPRPVVAAGAARRGRPRRRPRHRQPLRARRIGARLAEAPPAASARSGNRYAVDGARRRAARHHRRLPGLPGRDRSATIGLDRVHSHGYGFQVEMAYGVLRSRRHGRGGADHLPGPDPGHLEDVAARSSARPSARSPGGASGTGCCTASRAPPPEGGRRSVASVPCPRSRPPPARGASRGSRWGASPPSAASPTPRPPAAPPASRRPARRTPGTACGPCLDVRPDRAAEPVRARADARRRRGRRAARTA